MPTRWETFPVEATGGLVQNLPPIQQGMSAPGSAARLVNFEVSINGGYRRINGFTKFDSDPVPAVTSSNKILGVGLFGQQCVAAREGKIFQSEGSGWTEIATGRTQTTKHRFTIINLDGTRKIIGVDGSNYPYSWDGSSFVNINGTTDILGTSHAVEFKDHVFYAAGDLVTFSVPFDETDFTVADGAGSFRMPRAITGMIVFRQRLFIFTQNEIKVLDGDSVVDFRLTSVSKEVGCIAEDTIQEVSGDVAFLAADGIRLLGATNRDGDFSNSITSKTIQSNFNRFREDYTSFSTVLVRSKSQYRIFGFSDTLDSASSEGYIGVQFRPQDPESFQYSETRGIKAFSASSEVDSGSETIVFSNNDDYVYRMESGNDFDGVAIESSYWTPFISFNDPRLRKTLYKGTTYFSPEGDVVGTLTVDLDQGDPTRIQPAFRVIDISGGGAVWGSFDWDDGFWAGAQNSTSTDQLVGSCFNAQFQFAFTEAQAPFILDTFLVEYATEDRK